MNSREFYEKKINETTELIKAKDKIINILSLVRLCIMVAALISGYLLYKNSNLINLILIELIWLVIFVAIAVVHGNKIEKRVKLNALLEVNEKGINRLTGKFKNEIDNGSDLSTEGHNFCDDLDIFGNNSLFQYLNTARTEIGRRKLKQLLLLEKKLNKEIIIKRQEAIKELGDEVNWRQELYVEGTVKSKKNQNVEELLNWVKTPSNKGYSKIVVASVFILVTIVIFAMMIFKILPFSVLLLDLMINYVVIKMLSKDMEDVIKLFHKNKGSIIAYSKLIGLIEKMQFKSSLLKELKECLKGGSGVSATNEMKKLSSLLDWVGDSIGNAYYFLLNVFLFCDIFIMFNLDKWKARNSSNVEVWINVIGEFEALSSIANISFDHSDWSFGKISEGEIKAIEIKHPLIGEKAVDNNYELNNNKQISLITGSNMSGKSTFLRTLGINLVLTYIGAPAAAKEFVCPIRSIYTCMRTKDNLEESISSFYAEILRIKLIIEGCNKGEKAFVLLDEIFKGTNSRDRHLGATVLIKQLISCGAIGLVSTHDLELCDLEVELPQVNNYNFREYYKDNKIYFDYKLREGKSTTQNAVYLMKLAGIDF